MNILELADTFDLLDVDKDGRLSRAEIAALLRTVKVEPTRIELDFIFSEMDRDSKFIEQKQENNKVYFFSPLFFYFVSLRRRLSSIS